MRITTGAIITGSGQIAPNSVTETDILDGSITLPKLASAYQVPPRWFHFKMLGEDASLSKTMGYTDDFGKFAFHTSGTNFRVYDLVNGKIEARAITTDDAALDTIHGIVIIGLYVYVFAGDTANPYVWGVYRYLLTDLSAGGTLMTISGTALGSQNGNAYMNSDGTNFYFNCDAQNDATNTHEIAKYSLSGTTLTYVSTITCGATAANLFRFAVRASDGHIIGCNSSDGKLRRYNTSGTLQATSNIAFASTPFFFGFNYKGLHFYQADTYDTTANGYALVPIP